MHNVQQKVFGRIPRNDTGKPHPLRGLPFVRRGGRKMSEINVNEAYDDAAIAESEKARKAEAIKEDMKKQRNQIVKQNGKEYIDNLHKEIVHHILKV